MEGFEEQPADAGNPFDAGFDAPAVTPAEPFGAPVAAVHEPAAPIDNGLGGGSAGGAPLDDSFFGGSGGGDESAPGSNGGAALPQATFAAPTFDDPRIEWAHKNEAVLAQRAKAEATAKAEVLSKAKAHLEKLAKERELLLSKRKATNRELERTSNVAAGAVPSGDKPWERVLSVITFNREDAKGPHVTKDTFKELSRFKSVLLASKAANVPVSV